VLILVVFASVLTAALIVLRVLHPLYMPDYRLGDTREFAAAPDDSLASHTVGLSDSARTAAHRTLDPTLTPRIALVIDDLGNRYNDDVVQGLLALEIPITFGIIPGLRYSDRLAEAAHDRGHLVIAHVPMKPVQDRVGLGVPVLRPGMDHGEFQHALWFAFRLPHAVGLNNHMGSAATQDRELMQALSEECRQRGWFLLDSITHPRSVLYAEADAGDVDVLRRDIFLDHERGTSSVGSALKQAVWLARSLERPVVVIGHPRPDTWAVLRDNVGQLRSEGVQFVPLTTGL
jgi:polysaccharide deacetylase 2 family uncharacterized protein YibQ